MFIYQLPKEELEELCNFDEYRDDRYPKFYASKLEQEIRNSDLVDSTETPPSKTTIEADSIEHLPNPKFSSNHTVKGEPKEQVERIIPVNSEASAKPAKGNSYRERRWREKIGQPAAAVNDLFMASMEKVEPEEDEKGQAKAEQTKDKIVDKNGDGEKDLRNTRINQLFQDAKSKVANIFRSSAKVEVHAKMNFS